MKVINRKLLLVIFLLNELASFGQKASFNLSLVKKLDSAEMAAKDPGFHWEPLPQIGYDNLTGLSFGGIGSVFNNGKRTDSLYSFQNYKFRLDFAVGGSYKAGQGSIFDGDDQFYLKFDAPFVGGSRFRLNGTVNIEHNPYNLYFGVTPNSLRPIDELSQPGNDRFNYFDQKEKLANVNVEYMLFHGFLWPFVGLQFMDEQMGSPGNSLLFQDYNNSKVIGFGHTQTAYLRAGIKYDSRNNQDNCSRGVFLELTDEYAPKLNFSKTGFNKVFFHANFYTVISRNNGKPFFHVNTPRIFGPRDSVSRKINDLHVDWFSQNILAVRYALGGVNGKAPFYAYQDAWSSEDNISVLGGDNTLRGFQENRFAGNVVSFINVEWRANIFKIKDYTVSADDTTIIDHGKKKELERKPKKTTDYYDVALVPFFDLGGAWDNIGNYWQQFDHYKYSYGLGARVILNSDFVVRFDWGFSSEGSQQVLTLTHTF